MISRIYFGVTSYVQTYRHHLKSRFALWDGGLAWLWPLRSAGIQHVCGGVQEVDRRCPGSPQGPRVGSATFDAVPQGYKVGLYSVS